tara:strand:+ start:279 stop:605 length:327 start_codon:yes stop_codon:yes gene_type:complete
MVTKRKKIDNIEEAEVRIKIKHKKSEQNEQKTNESWKNIAYFNEYQLADTKRVKLLSENDKIQVKVKRCGTNGTKYVVKLRKDPTLEEKVQRKGKKSRKKAKNRGNNT